MAQKFLYHDVCKKCELIARLMLFKSNKKQLLVKFYNIFKLATIK